MIGSNGVDALLVGYYDDTGLRFAGKVRAGFVPHLRREVFKALKPRHTDDCPFVDLPNPKSSRWGGGVTAEEMREMQWVRPELVAQVRFVEWTAEGRLRHAAFLGLRSDKSAREVRRETIEESVRWPSRSRTVPFLPLLRVLQRPRAVACGGLATVVSPHGEPPACNRSDRGAGTQAIHSGTRVARLPTAIRNLNA